MKNTLPVWDKTSEGVEVFYQALVNYIAFKLSSKLEINFNLILSLFNDLNSRKNIYKPSPLSRFEEGEDKANAENNIINQEKLTYKLSDEELELAEIVFPIDKKHTSKLNFLSLFNLVSFKSCSFLQVDDSVFIIDITELIFTFEECKFDVDITLDGNFNDHSTKSYFNSCVFCKPVCILHRRLAQYEDNEEGSISYISLNSIFYKTSKIEELIIKGSYKNLPLFSDKNTPKINKLNFDSCEFSWELSLALDVKQLEITNSNFSQLFDLSNSIIEQLNISSVQFKKPVNFQECILGLKNSANIINFEYVEFFSSTNFSNINLLSPLSLVNNSFHSQPNFLGAKFCKESVINTSRETFRIIKYSFDAVGNHVEANQYFSYEMEAYRRELKAHKGNVKERILLNFNALISNHGQNYFKATAWWLFLVSFIGFILAIDGENASPIPSFLICFYSKLPSWWFTVVDQLNKLALGFFPFAPIYKDKEHLAAFLLLSGLLLAGITWHLLVAVRRHSKR